MFKYVTTLFALALIWVLVRIMNSQWYMRRNNNKKTRSVVHGLSAFLVLSFSQCATVSFEILGQNMSQSNHEIVNERRITVTHHGGLLYFKGNHLPYAIAAVFFLICIVIPPLLLLMYPLLLQLLSLCISSVSTLSPEVFSRLHIFTG